MTESTSTPTTQNRPVAPEKRRLFARLLSGLVLLLALLAASALWLVMSESGARTALSLVSSATGLQFYGVTGTLQHRLHVQRITLHEPKTELAIEDAELQWQPAALLRHQVRLDYLRVNRIELASASDDDQPAHLPQTLQLPGLIRLVEVGQLDIHRMILSDLEADRHHSHTQEYSALQGSISIDATHYQIHADADTPWGHATVQGSLGAVAPFKVQAQAEWSGLAIVDRDVTLPKIIASGTVSGNLAKLQLQAKVDSSSAENAAPTGPTKKNAQVMMPAHGSVAVVVTPFAVLPLESVQFDLAAVNPATLYHGAPTADLQIKADLGLSGTGKAPLLSGHVALHNAQTATWNSGGIPIVDFATDLSVSEHNITWSKTNITFQQNGTARGDGELEFIAAAKNLQANHTVQLPALNTQFDVSDLNLLLLDSRLKKTRLSGKIQTRHDKQQLDIALHLRESDPKLNAQLNVQMNLDAQLMLKLQKLELSAKDAALNATGYIGLRGKQEFSLNGEAHDFNPARWVDVPDGHVGTRFQVAGQLDGGWRVDAQLNELSGQFAGLDLHGAADLNAQQERLLQLKKLELVWGKNQLSAHGDWQLGKQIDATRHDQLQFQMAVPDLAGLSHPFEKILPVALQGSLFADGAISGSAAMPSGQLNIKATGLAIPHLVYLDNLQANLNLAEGAQGKFDGKLEISHIATSPFNAKRDDRFSIEHLQATLAGARHAHSLDLTVALPQQQQLTLHADGDLQDARADSSDVLQWIAKISTLNLAGPVAFQLQSPFDLQLSSQTARVGAASWKGQLGSLQLQQLNWQHGQLQTSGRFQDLPLLKALKLWRNDLPLSGKLTLNAAWQFDIGQQLSGQLQIQRSSGDLALQDTSGGHAQSIPLGLQQLKFALSVGDDRDTGVTALAHRPIQSSLQAQGDQLGLIDVAVTSTLNQTEQGWQLPPDAPLTGHATLKIKDIGWMSQLLGSGISLRGVLDAQAILNGSLDNPDYRAKINGQDLQISFTDIGVLLPNGTLAASIDGSQFNLESLKFSQTIKAPPKHDYLNNLAWLAQTGYVESTGSVDLRSLRGSINTTWDKFPFLQNPESWMVASGQAQLAESEKSWNLTGKLIADAAYFSVPKQAAPKLSSDVIVLKNNAKRASDKSDGLQTSLDFTISTGKKFIFVGRGIDTRLDGDLRIRSKNGGAILATGSIQTVGGNYEGYGQQLAIDRGILNFQGPIDNPGLNVRAIRRGLPVEAGVEVAGTVAKPEVHLISEPNVPDPDKLSWLVLGRASDQMAGSEAGLLMSAAGAIFGSDDGGSIPSSIAHTLGLEDLSFGTTSTSPESQLPAQTVAGTISSTAPTDQVFSVGKRIAPDIVFSIERSLTDASNGLKLTWQLTRRFSIIGRAGSDTAIDGQYTFSFD